MTSRFELIENYDCGAAIRDTTQPEGYDILYSSCDSASGMKPIVDMLNELQVDKNAVRRIAALGVKQPTENLGIAAGRMAYMRESLMALLRDDFSVLEAAERMFNDDKQGVK